MADGTISVNDSGAKLIRTNTRTVSSQTVHEEYGLNAEPAQPTFIASASGVSTATANSHLMQLIAGATLPLYICRISIYQLALATTAAIMELHLFRLTTAGTGGTAVTPVAYDTADGAAAATAATLPGVKGTEGNPLFRGSCYMFQTAGASAGPNSPIFERDYDKLKMKRPRIPAGLTNGLALKNVTAVAAGTLLIDIEFIEAAAP